MAALDLMRAAAGAVDRAIAAVPGDIAFRDNVGAKIRAQGQMLEPPATLSAMRFAPAVPEIEWRDPAEFDGAAILFACADIKYLKLFGAGLADSFRRTQPASLLLHLHVVTEDPEAEALLGELKGIDGRVRVSIERRTASATYYACDRFFVAPLLLRRYRLPAVCLDIDMELLRPFDLLLPFLDRADFGRFTLADALLPSLSPLACVMLMNPTAAGFDFLNRLAGLIEAKLTLPHNWMLDQAAIFSLERLNEVAPFFRGVDLSEHFDGHIGGFAALPTPDGKMPARLANV
jgi:hypothetical protein